MPAFVFGNFFAAELIVGVTPLTTTLQVPPSSTLLLPEFDALDNKEARLTLWDGQLPPEIVGCTVNAQDGNLIVTRGLEGTTAQAWSAGTQVVSSLTAAVINAALEAFFDFEVVLAANFLRLSGGTLTGPLILHGPPVDPLGAATKGYVDSVQGSGLPLSGGTMQGDINMNGNDILNLPAPTVPSNPATKAYADSLVTSPTNTFLDWRGTIVAGGTSAAYTITTSLLPGSYLNGQRVNVVFNVTNAASATLNMDGLGARPIHIEAGVAIPVGILVPGVPTALTYNAVATAWILNDIYALRGSNLRGAQATALTGAVLGDSVPFHDVSTVTDGKITLENIFRALGLLTSESSIAVGDLFTFFDVSAADMRVATYANLIRIPKRTIIASGSGSFTAQTGCRTLHVKMWAGGGGGGAAQSNNGSAGSASQFESWTVNGGGGGLAQATSLGVGAGGTGGSNGTGTLIRRIVGAAGGAATWNGSNWQGGVGGATGLGAGQSGVGQNGVAGIAGPANTGAGGGGGSNNSVAGSGGGSGEMVEFEMPNPGGSISFVVGAGGAGGAAGSIAGGAAGSGVIEVVEYY